MIDELLDLVDEQDRVIAQMRRSEVYTAKMSNFRAINAFIINTHGQLWVPRRAANKKVFPFSLDASIAGHVEMGESYEQAFAREAHEELNLDIQTVAYGQIGYCTPHTHNTSAFMKVYEINSDVVPQL